MVGNIPRFVGVVNKERKKKGNAGKIFSSFKDKMENLGKVVLIGTLAATVANPLYGQVMIGVNLKPVHPQKVKTVNVKSHGGIEATVERIAKKLERGSRGIESHIFYLFHHPERTKKELENFTKVVAEGIPVGKGKLYPLPQYNIKRDIKDIHDPLYSVFGISVTTDEIVSSYLERDSTTIEATEVEESNNEATIYLWFTKDPGAPLKAFGTKVDTIPVFSGGGGYVNYEYERWDAIAKNAFRVPIATIVGADEVKVIAHKIEDSNSLGEKKTDVLPLYIGDDHSILAIQYLAKKGRERYQGVVVVKVNSDGTYDVWNVVIPTQNDRMRLYATRDKVAITMEKNNPNGTTEAHAAIIDITNGKVEATLPVNAHYTNYGAIEGNVAKK